MQTETPTLLERATSFKNAVRYHIDKARYTPKMPNWPPPNWLNLTVFEQQEKTHHLQQRKQHLLQTYNLSAYPAEITGQVLYESLAMLDVLDRVLSNIDLPPKHLPQPTPQNWLDVGCKNWAYLPGQVAFAQKKQVNYTFTGVELDGYRRYANGFYRADYGHLMAHQSKQEAQYILGSVMEIKTPQFDVITCFLPFVFAEPLLAWGLCLKYFEPAAMLQHMLAQLKPNGLFLSTHLGLEEAEAYSKLLQNALGTAAAGTWQLQTLLPLPPTFVPYSEARYACLCRKLL